MHPTEIGVCVWGATENKKLCRSFIFGEQRKRDTPITIVLLKTSSYIIVVVVVVVLVFKVFFCLVGF